MMHANKRSRHTQCCHAQVSYCSLLSNHSLRSFCGSFTSMGAAVDKYTMPPLFRVRLYGNVQGSTHFLLLVYFFLIIYTMSHSAASISFSLPLPPNASTFSMSQVFLNSELVIANFRSSNSIANLYFPFVTQSEEYRALFGSSFSSGSLSPGISNISIPFCTLDTVKLSCLFPNTLYSVVVTDNTGQTLENYTITTPSLSQYYVSLTNMTRGPFSINQSIQLPPLQLNIMVRRRRIFIFYENLGNFDEVNLLQEFCCLKVPMFQY